MGFSWCGRKKVWGLARGNRGILPGQELYPLPAEFPSAAVARLLAVARGGEKDPRVIAHALWHLAGYGLYLTGEAQRKGDAVNRPHPQSGGSCAASPGGREPRDRGP